MKIFVETERLILREIVREDAEGMFKLDSDGEVLKYLHVNPVKSIEEVNATIDFIRQQYLENGIGRWAMIEKDTNAFIGWVGLKLVRESINNMINYYDLGYRIIKEHWGNGYASEAAQASIEYGFSELHLTEIYAMADVDNFGSDKVLKKCGLKKKETFNYNGKLHNWYKINNEYQTE
ncbi:GNAT family N-acetyltransferase [Sporocytophaga myxococcoides]|uniref:GNAT family N-acetyltransferase n=1 Tax=Sporocytophaga myxococcoides TaxID=153721 RepID=UPI00048D3BEB|nr:GNAT family N-acetyltransferase [Sporocytophaga myxococcoides]